MADRRATLSEMDQRIDLFSVTQSVDDSGGVLSESEPFIYPNTRQLWAKVTRTQGSEKVEADVPTAMARAKIETRFVPGVLKTMIVAWQSIRWQIVDLDPQPRHDRLIIFAERRGESGAGDA